MEALAAFNEDLSGVLNVEICHYSSANSHDKIIGNCDRFIRVSYISGVFSITTNAFLLQFPQTSEKSSIIEMIYLHHDPSSVNLINNQYNIRRILCQLVEYEDKLWIHNEQILSTICEKNIPNVVQLFWTLSSSEKNFNLTFLRKIASKKINVKSVQMILENDNVFPTQQRRHTIEVQIHLKTVVISYMLMDETSKKFLSLNYLAKTDILHYVKFLRLMQNVIHIEKETFLATSPTIATTSTLMKDDSFSPTVKLSNLGNRILTHKSNLHRNKKKHKTLMKSSTDIQSTTLYN